MIDEMATRRLDVDLLVRELGNWRTSSSTGPAYQGLSDGLRMLIVDGRLPIGAQVPSERALADALRVSRTTVTAAYAQMRDDGYLNGRRGARSTTTLPISDPATIESRPVVVDLARAAMSAPASEVLDAFTHAAQELMPYLHDTGLELSGLLSLRTAIAERYCARGLPTEPDEVMVTTGALHAIGLILAAYVETGDRVLVEQPTYPGALATIAACGARAIPVSLNPDGGTSENDGHGWEVDAIHAAIRQMSPALAYFILDNHNPTGLTMSAPDRGHLARVIAETRTRTIIDETMTDIWLGEPVPAPMAAAMTSRRDLVLTVGSMSKSFWGGLRIGWIRAERRTLAGIAALRPSVDMGTPIVEQLAAARLLGSADELLPARRAQLRRRRELALSLLATHLPDWTPGPGGDGVALWVRLPAPMSSALSAAASRIGLDVPPGPRFGMDGSLERYLRVPYTLPESQLTEAIELLARAWYSVTGTGGSEFGAVVV
jgi:DNA-binding transcriptional MocR family regulator